MRHFEIDPDIRKATTLPSDFYTDPVFFGLSKEKIFSRSWQFVGHISSFKGLTPFTLLPGSLDEPLLFVRSGDGLECLSNVCTHRGKLLVESPCDAQLIRCGYHGRRFSLDGKFLSMPEFEAAVNFPTEADDLCKVSSSVLAGFVFASLDPHVPFNKLISDTDDALFSDASGILRLSATREYEINAHWALYCENYLEGFHIPYVHKTLNEVVAYDTYSTDLFRYSSLQTGYDADGNIIGRYLFVFPNLMFNFYAWGVSVNVVRPVTPSNTVVEFLTYVNDDGLIETSTESDLHAVEMEDEAVVESVQRGIRSRFYTQGRYSPTREQGTHHFHRLIAEFLG